MTGRWCCGPRSFVMMSISAANTRGTTLVSQAGRLVGWARGQAAEWSWLRAGLGLTLDASVEDVVGREEAEEHLLGVRVEHEDLPSRVDRLQHFDVLWGGRGMTPSVARVSGDEQRRRTSPQQIEQ